MKTTKTPYIAILLGLLFVLFGATLRAQLPSRPVPPRLVNDFTGTLSASQVSQLETMLVNYNDTTSTQIVVILVNDLQGYDVAEYATEIGQEWGVGQGGKDNGAVILVKPKTESSKGRVNISVGYGLEQYITDAVSKQIIEKEMIPSFAKNDYYTGIVNAIQVMMDLCSGKFTADEYANKDDRIPIGLIILVIIAIILILRSGNGNQHYSSGGNRTIWIPMGGGFGGGGFGGGHSSGGLGGGGFGGFGGGSFGGGGASGSW